VAIGITLLVAGAYQLTPWKGTCLRQCRSPLALIMTRWPKAPRDALKLGIEHGTYCVGCCWALMLLLFAGGVMNLIVIAGVTAIVLVEKVTRIGVQASRALGIGLLAAGIWFLTR
jgi:predicted metal-binding membrane protein